MYDSPLTFICDLPTISNLVLGHYFRIYCKYDSHDQTEGLLDLW